MIEVGGLSPKGVHIWPGHVDYPRCGTCLVKKKGGARELSEDSRYGRLASRPVRHTLHSSSWQQHCMAVYEHREKRSEEQGRSSWRPKGVPPARFFFFFFFCSLGPLIASEPSARDLSLDFRSFNELPRQVAAAAPSKPKEDV